MWKQPALTAAFLAALLACSSDRPSGRAEVAPYLRQLAEWAPQEAEVARAVSRILDTQFVDEGEVRRQVAESQPRVTAQIETLAGYEPRSQAIRDVHARYLDGWRRLGRGYEDIVSGLDAADQEALARGRAALLAWRETVRGTAARLRELADESTPEMEQGPAT